MTKIKLLFTIAILAISATVGLSQSITTTFAGGNGGATGWAVMYDATIGPGDLDITEFDVNTSSGAGTAFTLDFYTTPGGFGGNESNMAAWTLVGTGSGTAAGLGNPSNVVLDAPVTVDANTTYGFAIVLNGASPAYTNGNGGNQNFSNADISLALGSSISGTFSGTVFSPRVWNGTVYYQSAAPPPPPNASINHPLGDGGGGLVEEAFTVTCGTALTDYFDSGGEGCDITGNGSYDNNANTVAILCPDAPGQPITLEFFEVDIETRGTPACWDFLTIHDGNSTAAPVLFNGCGEEGFDSCPGGFAGDGSDGGGVEGGPQDINASASGVPANVNNIWTSSDATGCLTVAFTSDGSVDQGGWIATLGCEAIAVPGCDITCPADISVPCEGGSDPAVTGMATTGTDCVLTYSDMTAGCTISRTWTSTAPSGQITQCIQIITLIDDLAPVVTCPPGQTLTCFQTIPAPHMTAADFIAAGGTLSDNCTGLDMMDLFSQDSNNGGDNCPGNATVITRTYFITDDCGNVSTCDQVFTYTESSQGPVITSVLPTCFKYCASLANPMEADITYDTDCSYGATVNITGPQQIGQDNCPGSIYRYTYTVTDDCGRTSIPVTRDFVIGNDGPTIECAPFNLLLECGDPNNADYIAAHIATATANSSCELGVNITHFPTNFNNITCNTSTVVTFRATDDCGRQSTCTTTINISDNTAPEVTSTYIPGQCDEIECSANVNFFFNEFKSKVLENLSATDACDSNVSFTTSGPNTPNQNIENGEAVTSVDFIANDNCGNTTTLTYEFTVLDSYAPVIANEPADETIDCGDPVVFGNPTATDECGNVTVTIENESLCVVSGTISGDQEVPPSGSNGSGMISGNLDDINNTLTLDLSFSGLDGNTAAAHIHNAPAGSNGGVIVNLGGLGFPLGVTAGDFSATIDLTPAQVAEAVAGNLYVNIHTEAVPSGEIRGQIAVDICTKASTRTWTFDDNNGNTSMTSQTITIVDTQAPVAMAPADVNVQCASDVPPPVDLTANDACEGDITVSPSAVITPGNCDNQFTMVRTWTFVDNCGNQSSVSQTITVNDDTAPVAPAAPADVNIQCADDVPPPVNLTANDNCDGDITVSPSAVITPGNCDNQFTMVRTWTFVDMCGNQSSVSQTITVNDDIAPVAPAAPADVNVQCADDVPPPVDLTANDNCDGDITVSPSAVITPGNCDDQFTMFRTWTFVDMCGNQSSVTQTITVNDDIAPEFTFVPADYSGPCINDDGSVTVYAQVCASSDDAEEDTETGEMDLMSSDLELIQDESQNKEVEVGVRFKDLHIPAGATITSAYIQFTVDATIGYDPSELVIDGEDSDNASTFTLANGDISDRPRTTASADWEPADWEVIGDSKGAQRTTDLAAIVQEIVDRGGYTSESALAFFFNGIGKRTAISWDKNPAQAPELFVTYEGPVFDMPTATDNCSNVTITVEEIGDMNDCAGSYTRVWTATDDCGNSSTASQTFNFTDNVPPVFTSVPDHINIACEDASFPLTFGDPTVADNCDDDVALTFVDEWITGDADSCDEDDEDSEYRRTWTATDACGNTSTAQQRFNLKESYALSGIVTTENNTTVEDVTVSLEGFNGLTMTSQTGADGFYGFSDLELNANYAVTPALDLDPLNGVSSYDLVLITKHILQMETLDSPYKMIAADVNNSGSITTMDLVELRKLILHVDDAFANNTSWRFVEANYVFPVPNNPFATIFPEETFINGLQLDEIHNFIGVKIGDVNNSVIANGFVQAEDRNTVGDLVFTTADQELKAGQSYTVSFQADNFDALHGYQFTMNFDQAALEFEGLKAGNLENMSDNNFGLALLEEGVITTSWTNQDATSLRRDANVFDLTFTAKSNVMLSEVLSINSRYTQAEAYNADLELMNVDLRFDTPQGVANEYRLYQNTPNPFRQETTIGFDLPMDMSAKLSIFDAAGRQLKLVEGDFNKGYNQIIISKDELSASGVLYYQLVTESFEETRKMVLN